MHESTQHLVLKQCVGLCRFMRAARLKRASTAAPALRGMRRPGKMPRVTVFPALRQREQGGRRPMQQALSSNKIRLLSCSILRGDIELQRLPQVSCTAGASAQHRPEITSPSQVMLSKGIPSMDLRVCFVLEAGKHVPL